MESTGRIYSHGFGPCGQIAELRSNSNSCSTSTGSRGFDYVPIMAAVSASRLGYACQGESTQYHLSASSQELKTRSTSLDRKTVHCSTDTAACSALSSHSFAVF